MLLPLLPHHQRREGEVPFPRERCVLSQDYPKKKKKIIIIIIIIIIITYILFSKEKKKSYIYRQTLAITLIKKYIFNYIFCKFNY